MGRRTILLVAAVLLAAIGTGVLFLYVRSTSGSTTSSEGTAAVLAPKVPIQAGTGVSEGLFDRVSVDRTALAKGQYVTAFTQIRGKVATRDLPAFVPVASSQFAGTVQKPTDLGVQPGMVALTLEVEDPARVSSFLRPGAKVALFVVDADDATGKARHEARLLMSPVTVLTTGTSGTLVTNGGTNGSKGDSGSQSLVTLLVEPDQAGPILVAQAAGEIYFALLGPGAAPTRRTYDDKDIQVD